MVKLLYIRVSIFLFIGIYTNQLYAQIYFDTARSVKVVAVANSTLSDITVSWVDDPGSISYQLYRKTIDDTTWGEALGTYTSPPYTYRDQEVITGQLHEYRVVKEVDTLQGYGYALSAINLAPKHYEGRLLIVIDNESLDSLSTALDEYIYTLRGDGWTVSILNIDSNLSPSDVKVGILDAVALQPDISSLLLLGAVPVPHSGNINPDAHNNHKGAWSADLYYGDLDGVWTDESVSNSTSENPLNHNEPADGRFDQSFIPSDIELQVGRVDFTDLPVFEESSMKLLEKYLQKDIAYRTKALKPRQRAAIKQTNQWKGGLGQNGIRNFSALVGPDSISYDTFEDGFQLSYLWFYGGGSGSYTSATFMGNSERFATDSLQFVFTSFFGSYFGDYDTENNYLRAILGSGTVLSSAWVGAPHWYYHPMAMGKTLGYCTRLTQNNNSIYSSGFFPRSVHVNLLGDPTLKSFIVDPPKNILAEDTPELYGVQLNWEASQEAISQYHIYKKQEDGDTSFTLLTSTVELQYADPCAAAGEEFEYLVRAEKLETSPTGTFYNLSSGPIVSHISTLDYSVIAAFDFSLSGNILSTLNMSQNATDYIWLLPDGTTLSEKNIELELTEDIVLNLIASNPCNSDTVSTFIGISAVSKYSDKEKINLYPNPAANTLTVSSKTKIESIKIFDTFGKEVHFQNDVNKLRIALNISTLPNGIYTLYLRDNYSLYKERFFKI